MKTKILQTEIALDRLKQFGEKTDESISSTGEDSFLIRDQVAFYCDSFWVFLYSSLDVLAQIANQCMKLDYSEDEVSYKKLKGKFNSETKYKGIYTKWRKCLDSKAFKNLERYRNCSVHRRQICIFEDSTSTKITPGYSSSVASNIQSVVRTLCDNPYELNPKKRNTKTIPLYLQNNKTTIMRYIVDILKEIENEMRKL